MPAPIIAAYEPLTEDRATIELALAAAELTDAPVIAAAVFPLPVADGWAPSYAEDDTMERIAAATSRLGEELGVETRIVPGASVPAALHALARELDAGLIVVGSTRRGTAGRVLAGSTADRLLQGAPCPVALAPRDYTRAPVQTIGIGFVDSPEGRAALTAAHALAARVGGRLRVIAALQPSGGLEAVRAPGPHLPRGTMLEGRHRTEVEAALERTIGALPGGVEVETELHVDDPADILLAVSAHVDLLVCGSRGYGPLRSVLLGGVSRRLVEGSQCPVLIVPRGAVVPMEDLAPDTD
jgi:nucleotide-binding universal stress UspA family protein